MKMRSLSRFFMGMLAMCAIAACSNDELDVNGTNPDPDASGDAVYMNVTVQLPTGAGTRADGGTEVGLDRENKVNSVLVVLASKSDEFIACAEKFESLTTETDGKITAVQSLSKSALSTYYEKNGSSSETGKEKELSDEQQKVNVYVFCNPTETLRTFFAETKWTEQNKNWYDGICSIEEDVNGTGTNMTIWGGPNHTGGFLMSSAQVSTKRIPKKLSDWNGFTKVDNPFKLSGLNNMSGGTDSNIDNSKTVDGQTDSHNGAIAVERSVARFDFKNGSGNDNNTYNVVKNPDDNTKFIVDIELQKMALVNMSKNFYYLRRVSKDGLDKGETNTNEWALCGTESSTNYVVDTDAAGKNTSITDYTTNFNFCLGNKNSTPAWAIDAIARGQWYTSEIKTVLDGTEDNPSWSGGTSYGDYRIWRYVTENTIPGDVGNQKNGISTGIVFKGKMIPVEGTTGTLADALNGASGDPDEDPILYVYNDNIYVSWKEVRAAAIQKGTGDLLYKAAFGDASQDDDKKPTAEVLNDDGSVKTPAVYSSDEKSADYLWNQWYNEKKEGTNEPVDKKDKNKLAVFKKTAVGKNFTLYQSSEESETNRGYFCYYFYWNRHNDNTNPGVMGPMEFAVVRNNVYKLAVTTIKKLGHPRLSENDPDPVTPDKPDEKEDLYLSVSVEVLPWVVRVNDIEF